MMSRQHALNSLRTYTGFLLSLSIAIAATPSQADISQKPLLLGGGSVPGNLALVPSVEWPTILSMANLGNYSTATKFTGYFDSEKCYQYSHDATNTDRRDSHFYPVSITTTRNCSGNLWSGNYLNWAATQTIDPFRSALTGGYRIRDTNTETWLEKARHDGQSATGSRGISGSTTVQNATPANWWNFNSRVSGLGNRLRFTRSGDWNGTVHSYTPNTDIKENLVYEVYIRVKVCDASVGLEANCEKYSQGYKPEGLIQQYANEIRYSVFGYLNDSGMLRDGGVLRAQQKFVGENMRTPGVAGIQTNAANEWDPVTGVMIRNPDADSALATNASILDSGVINYLNKFGQMTTQNHKSHDPVSELFYTALRYFKGQGNVASYTNMAGSVTARYNLADGFPVITSWNDPIQYACQKNVILGIGDTNTHRDKNLPGNNRTNDEPAVPIEVSSDNTINVAAATQKVAALEGITINTPFTGRENSAYMVGLAYDANTKDIRSSISGKQTVSTYWVDVRENESLAGRASNQYWLAAKYGGFKVPKDFGDPYARTAALETEWWRTNTDMLATNYPRPDNFFVASDATNMVVSLRKAFAQISNEVQSTTASLATNSTRLETDTAVFQSRLDSRFWSGDLLVRRVGANGEVENDAAWSAAQKLDNLSSVDSRKIFSITPATTSGNSGETIATNGTSFTWDGLDNAQRALLQRISETDSVEAQKRLAYLRGDRTNEITTDDRTKPFRQRGSRLGDIVNSDPQFIHKQDFGYSRLSWNNGAIGSAYNTFRTSSAYQNRIPTVIVGANDGMLHGFDARVSATADTNGGAELFAYVPNSVFSNLINLTDPAYSHRYFVDGTPRVSDVWVSGSWMTMVVGTTGAGGKSVFALDVTNPGSMTSGDVMWEFSHPDMGYTVGQPALVALPNEKFGVVVSSGYHDTAPESGKIWILDAADGAIIRQIDLPTTGNLGSPLASDTNFDQVADRVYVADTLGNVWRIDLSGGNPSSWDSPKSLGDDPLFIAKNASGNRQAITAPLSSAFNDKNEHMVFFGTGSFYRDGDNEIPENPSIDTFYGIIDRGETIDGRGSLLKQAVIKEATLESGINARAITNNALTTETGWYIDLGWLEGEGATGARGERVIAKATLRSDRVIFTTMTPSADPCAFGGTSFIMAMNLSSGSRLNYVYFDTSGDGKPDDGDTTTSGDDKNIPWTGIDIGDGVVKGTAPLPKLLCFAGSSGATPQCIPVAGSQRFGRHSWREVRTN
jgi:type IV pilus assembly protein PilY1